MDNFSKILDDSYRRALKRRTKPFISNNNIRKTLETVVLCLRNRAGVRALLAGLLAKIDSPSVDIRKPYTEIAGDAGDDRYSGRFYDERYIQQLADLPYRLPINATTAFLTPGFRTKNTVLAVDVSLEGRPAEMYGPCWNSLTPSKKGVSPQPRSWMKPCDCSPLSATSARQA